MPSAKSLNAGTHSAPRSVSSRERSSRPGIVAQCDRTVQVCQGDRCLDASELLPQRGNRARTSLASVERRGPCRPCAGRVAISVAQEPAREIDHEIVGSQLDDLVVIGQRMEQVFF